MKGEKRLRPLEKKEREREADAGCDNDDDDNDVTLSHRWRSGDCRLGFAVGGDSACSIDTHSPGKSARKERADGEPGDVYSVIVYQTQESVVGRSFVGKERRMSPSGILVVVVAVVVIVSSSEFAPVATVD